MIPATIDRIVHAIVITGLLSLVAPAAGAHSPLPAATTEVSTELASGYVRLSSSVELTVETSRRSLTPDC